MDNLDTTMIVNVTARNTGPADIVFGIGDGATIPVSHGI